MAEKWDVAVLGGGPGGYVAAIRAARLKKRTVLIEKEKIGGTCMNHGCIPTKHLLHQTKLFQEIKKFPHVEGQLGGLRLDWKAVQRDKRKVVERLTRGLEFLLKRNGVEVVKGEAFLRSEKEVVVQGDEEKVFETEHVILATGSRSADLPFLKPNGKEIVTSREALEFEDVPRKLLIVGAGAIGLELGAIYSRAGSEVTILEIMPTILPGSDRDMTMRLERLLKIQGLNISTGMQIEKAEVRDGKIRLSGTCLKSRQSFDFEGEKALLAAGRKADSESFQGKRGIIAAGKNGFVEVDAFLRTNVSGIYAIGDVIGGKLLAHKASHEGIVAAENISGAGKVMDYGSLPMAVFTEPEFASVGMTEEEAREKGITVQVGLFPLSANGRALTLDRTEGMVKIIGGERDEIIGAHILAPNAGELIAELTLAIHKKLKIRDVASTIHIHPTLSEAVMEAAMKARNEAIHVLND